jgi:hypothetical protein
MAVAGAFRSFEALRGTADWCTSLAYWLGPYRGALESNAVLGVGAAMSFQYDSEEQADAFGRALPIDETWTKVFAPVAPVQLTSRWSPLACAIEILGAPSIEAVTDGSYSRMAVVAWDPDRVSSVTSTARQSASADEKRFVGLLTVSVTRARERRRGVLVAAQPGWSYETVHPISKTTARLMGKAGFVVTTRKP